MDFTLIAFYAFAVLAAAAAIGVISVRNPVVAALLLVLTFFSIACTWIIAGAEFLGVALIVVYVGAVMVLFLFVVMMLDLDVEPLREGFVKFLPVGIVVAVIMLAEILTLIGVRAKLVPFKEIASDVPNSVWLARSLFTEFLLPFEVAAIILTMAVVAAVMLTLRRRPGIKHQIPSDQVRVKAGNRLRMVKMSSSEKRVVSNSTPNEEASQ